MSANYSNYVTEEQVEQKSTNLQFGLNQNCKFIKITKVSPEEGNSTVTSFDFHFLINGTETKKRIYPVTKVKDKNTGVDIVDPNHEDFKKAIAAQQGWFTSFFKVFTTEEKIQASIKAAATANNGNLTFEQYVGAQYKITPAAEYEKVAVDIFLEYGAEKDGKKYLEIPSYRSAGKFITLAQQGEFKEVKDKDGLKYVNAEMIQHPISRNKWWLDNSNGAKGSSTTTGAMNAANAAIMSAPGAIAAPSTPPSTNVDDMDW